MGKTDWNITGDGGISVIEEGGSKRCRLSANKLMLWNENSTCTDFEVVADIKLGANTNYRGGITLRSDESGSSMYRLRIHGASIYRTYYIDKLVNGVNTILGQVNSYHPYNTYVRTKFKVDGFQLSVEEWIDGAWVLALVIEDTSQAILSGYCGIFGTSVNSSYYITFDNIEMNKKE